MKNNEILDANNMMNQIADIKKDIVLIRNRILNESNKELILLYFRIGKVISENREYGSNFITTLSTSLKIDYPDAAGFSPRNLSRMRKFYETYRDLSNLPPAVAKLPWTHNIIILERIKTQAERDWYIEKCLENGWSKDVLEFQIHSHLYQRQANNRKKQSNFPSLLTEKQSLLALNIMKDPYVFEISGLSERVFEKNIERAMIERIKNLLLELGKGFSFVGNQYRISTESKDYYIDLLFYHLTLRCFVVVELKNADFDPSYIGQLQFYITAVDEVLKRENDNPTIGLLLCKDKDRYSVEWALKSSNVPIGVASYSIGDYLPSEDEINKYLK